MEKKDIILIGAGGFGREILWQLGAAGGCADQYNILGFADDTPSLQGARINGFPVLGNVEWLSNYHRDIGAVICVGNATGRENIYNRLKGNSHICFPTILAGDVRRSDSVTFGQGCIVCLSTILTVNITIGSFVIANLDCTIGHDAVLDDFVTLYPSVNVSGNVHIGAGAEIGTGTNIIQGKAIGKNAIVGAGSVVVKDIPADCTAVGIPAKPIKFHP